MREPLNTSRLFMVDERDTVDTSLLIFPEYCINAGFL